MSVERRRHPRVNFSTALDIYYIGVKEPISQGIVKNISLGGMSFETDNEFATGSDLEFRFDLGENKWVKVKGMVMWQTPSSGSFIYGIMFTKVSFFDKLKLKKFMKHALVKNGQVPQ